MSIYRSASASFLGFYLFCTSAFAGISMDSSRLVFPASSGVQGQVIGVTSNAQSTVPYLVKAQVLGDVQGSNLQTPFSVTPSLFRLEIGATNQLRIIKTGDQLLPNDKESLFYLRVMALPAGQKNNNTPLANTGSSLVVSTGSIIKLFYRPQEFSISQKQAMSSLQFSLQGSALKVNNPSPYFITLSSLSVGGKKINIDVNHENTMIAPFGSLTYPEVNIAGKVTWQAINDYGGKEKFNADIQ